MKNLLKLILAFAVFLPFALLAQDPVAAPDAASPAVDAVSAFIINFSTTHPWVVTVFTVIGILRTIFKPIVTALEARAAATADTADDAKLAAAESSWWFKALSWVLDFGASIKLAKK